MAQLGTAGNAAISAAMAKQLDDEQDRALSLQQVLFDFVTTVDEDVDARARQSLPKDRQGDPEAFQAEVAKGRKAVSEVGIALANQAIGPTQAHELLSQMNAELAQGAAAIGKQAIKIGQPKAAAPYLKIADDAERETAKPAPAPTKDTTSGWDVVDAVGDVGGPLNDGILGIGGTAASLVLEAGPVTTALATVGSTAVAAATLGFMGGGFGIAFGLLGIVLATRSFLSGRRTSKQLRAVLPGLTDKDLEAAAAYGIQQSDRKTARAVALGVAATVATAAGVIGLIAVSVGTFGLGAAIIGMVAAGIGLGFLAFKGIRKRWKRNQELKAASQTLMDNARRIGADRATSQAARKEVQGLGLPSTPPWIDDDADRAWNNWDYAGLEGALRRRVQSKRQQTATLLGTALNAPEISTRVQTEAIIESLGLDPDKLRGYGDDEPGRAKAEKKLAGALGSW